jgi:crotonobetainyl-CoA:carnitine CoA-transferase CaiB-like acyl-CoA transferase
MLDPYRVLDLTDERGELAGMVLGDLGADVIRVEPPGGSDARRRGPRLAGGPEPERSLQFLAYNRNKRSIVLDLGRTSDRDTFSALVERADFVLESAPPSLLAAHGFPFEALRERSPRIVHVQITPFGSDGPHASFAASDLTIGALGGSVGLQGVRDRAPVRVSVPQVWRHAGVEAAVAALVAHARMLRTGEAQRVDVSAQCAMTWTMLNAMSAAAIQGRDFERNGSLLQLGVLTLPLVFACADGHVVLIPGGGVMRAFVSEMIAAGLVEASFGGQDWPNFERNLLTGQTPPDMMQRVLEAISRFVRLHPKRELLERGLARGVTVAPVNTLSDLLAFEQLAARDFWQKVALPDGRSVRAPGAFARPSARPLATSRPAPRLDQHGAEIRLEVATAAAPRPSMPAPDGALPFAGLKVADFSWIGVGPISARYLADHGANVVRVESETRPDNLRGAGPFKDGVPGWNRSHFFAEFNTSKRGLLLDLRKDAAREVAKRLIAWADVYVESFSPGTLDKLGLGYEAARALNPGVVMMSTCLMGQSGPAAALAGYGYHAGAVAGFYEVTGWPDLPPDGPWMAYTDTIAPRFVAATLMAALDHRRRTGLGQHIDGAQLEMGLQFLAPEILELEATGFQAGRIGNRSREGAPHGVYPCAGEDQWCAIAIDTDEQWRALGRAMRGPVWEDTEVDAALEHAAGRLAHQDAIDARLAAWTRPQDARALCARLLAAGVPAGVVQRSSDLLRDPQYAHRGFYRELVHSEMGPVPYAGHQFRIGGYPSGPRSAAPTLGEHSALVLQELGYGDDEVAALYAAGAIA